MKETLALHFLAWMLDEMRTAGPHGVFIRKTQEDRFLKIALQLYLEIWEPPRTQKLYPFQV